MSKGKLRVERDGPVGRLGLDNPERRNAIGAQMWLGIPPAIDEFNKDAAVCVVRIRGGSTQAFAAGGENSQFGKNRSGGHQGESGADHGRVESGHQCASGAEGRLCRRGSRSRALHEKRGLHRGSPRLHGKARARVQGQMSAVASRTSGSLVREVDALLERATDAGDVPGVVAMAIAGDATIYEGAFGTRRLGATKPMAIDTVVWIASMTKPVTSAAAMQLVEQGRVKLDEPAARWAPELSAVQVLQGFDAAGVPPPRPPQRPLTPPPLLTPTSRFGHRLWGVPPPRDMGTYSPPPPAAL